MFLDKTKVVLSDLKIGSIRTTFLVDEAIKQQRLRLGFTRAGLSKRVNISSDYLSKIENKGQAPSLKVLRKLVSVLNLSVDPYFQPKISFDKSLQHKKIEQALQQYSNDELNLILHLLEQGITFKNDIKT